EEFGDTPRDLSAVRTPVLTYGFSGRYQDLFLALAALEVLRDARPLRMDGVTGTGHGPVLDDTDVALIERLGDALASSLTRLVRSSRPDWGFPLLVGMARLVAFDETRRAGHWMFLDAFPSDAETVPAPRILGHPALIRALLDEARPDFAAARARLDARAGARPGFPEADFLALEAAGNRLIEIVRTLHDGRPMRLATGFD